MKQRVLKDLKGDPKKTVFMVVLAVVLAVICWIRFNGDDKAYGNLAASLTDSSSKNVETPGLSQAEADSLPFPAFLKSALPFEEIGSNPFEATFLLNSDKLPENTLSSPERRDRQGAEPQPSETQNAKSFQVTCTLTGDQRPFAIVDGAILEQGDDHKGFKVKEIGDGFVIFEGQGEIIRVEVPF
ncbi:MAG: hypothetical protein KJ645_06130 [Planctomycetes bacterium]|nr:hypothetical protein [Planctomycetota bacterium]